VVSVPSADHTQSQHAGGYGFRSFEIRICFGFRDSDFGFLFGISFFAAARLTERLDERDRTAIAAHRSQPV
jgi:hypothetical protein